MGRMNLKNKHLIISCVGPAPDPTHLAAYGASILDLRPLPNVPAALTPMVPPTRYTTTSNQYRIS